MVRYFLRTGAAAVAVSVCLMTLPGASAQENDKHLSPGPNGIHVGEAKLFDERTLMQMLEAAENNLASLRFYDQQGVSAAIGRLQGARLDQSALAITATTLPRPASKSTLLDEQSSSGNSELNESKTVTIKESSAPPAQPTKSNDSVENTGSKSSASATSKLSDTTSEESTELKPAPPPLPTPPGAFSFGGQLGIAAQDVLAEQTMLTYQVMNLRLLLDRSISDRIFASDAVLGPLATASIKSTDKDKDQDKGKKTASSTMAVVEPRRLAVVGFQINIEPAKRYKNAVAEIQVRIHNCGVHPDQLKWSLEAASAKSKERCAGYQKSDGTSIAEATSGRPSVVALMPQEKTYNVATLTRRSTSLGFGALVSVFNLGVSGSRSRETIYLVKDTDTVALTRAPEHATDTSFGWQFRPVLGRPMVEPGIRQVFAVLALPNPITSEFVGAIEVTTVWRKYDSKTGVAGDAIGKTTLNTLQNPFVVPSVDRLNSWMQPTKPFVNLMPAGHDSMFVELVRGTNLNKNTKLLVGASAGIPGQTLELQGERGMRFLVPTASLAGARGVYLAGTYGESVAVHRELGPEMIVKDAKAVASVGATTSTITVDLQQSPGPKQALVPYVIRDGIAPILLLGDTAVTAATVPVISQDVPPARRISYRVPTDLLRNVKKVTVKELLGEDTHVKEVAIEIAPAFDVSQMTILSRTQSDVTLAVAGSQFKCPGTSVVINNSEHVCGGTVITLQSADLLTLKIPAADYAASARFVFKQAGTTPVMLIVPVPSDKPAAAKPQLPATLATVAVGTVKTVTISGRQFGSIAAITFDGIPLRFQVPPGGNTLDLLLTTVVTQSAGEKEIAFELTDGTTVRGVVVVTR